jgi:hypothetical protein
MGLDQDAEAGFIDLSVPYSKDSEAARFEHRRADGVEVLLLGRIVVAAVNLEDEAQLSAVEVADEAANRMLAAELETEQPAVTQQAPRRPLRSHRPAT